MAKQIAGLCFLEGTFDDLTFYKMDGQYYARAKSSLTSQRVKTSPEFKWTMIYARLLARASKIGSQVYKALPPGWRQFWMYRSFTGEAFTLLKKNSYTDEQVKQFLWKCYVEYWEQMKAVDPSNPIWQPKPEKIRKRRVYSLESLLRQKDKSGKPKWRNLEEEERKRLAKERNNAAYTRLLQKEKEKQEQQQTEIDQALTPEEPGTHQVLTPKESEILHAESGIYSPWQVTPDGNLYTKETPTIYTDVGEACYSSSGSTEELTANSS